MLVLVGGIVVAIYNLLQKMLHFIRLLQLIYILRTCDLTDNANVKLPVDRVFERHQDFLLMSDQKKRSEVK